MADHVIAPLLPHALPTTSLQTNRKADKLTESQNLPDMSGLLQGSGVSVTSDYKLNAEWKLNQQDIDRINSGVEPLLTGIAVPRCTAPCLPAPHQAQLQTWGKPRVLHWAGCTQNEEMRLAPCFRRPCTSNTRSQVLLQISAWDPLPAHQSCRELRPHSRQQLARQSHTSAMPLRCPMKTTLSPQMLHLISTSTSKAYMWGAETQKLAGQLQAAPRQAAGRQGQPSRRSRRLSSAAGTPCPWTWALSQASQRSPALVRDPEHELAVWCIKQV